jgi:hypothetical protein
VEHVPFKYDFKFSFFNFPSSENFAPTMFASLPQFDASLQPWQLNLLRELFPQIVAGNVERPLGVSGFVWCYYFTT